MGAPPAGGGVVTAGCALAGDLAVVLDPFRIRAEEEGVLAVVEGVEDDLDGVGLVEVAVPAALRDEHPFGLAVEGDDSHVERGLGEEQADFRPLGGRGPVVRFLLG